jgi:hypothetical protein
MCRLTGSLLLAIALALAGCGIETVRGSGKVISETRSVSGFDSVAMFGSGKLVIEQGETESVTVTADDNLLPRLPSEVRGGKLQLGGTGLVNLQATQEVVYTIKLRALDGISVVGSGEVVATGVNTERLEIEGSGSSDFTIQGRAQQLDVEISGSGSYQGEELASEVASVQISGSGSAIVAASQRLDVAVSGSGSVEYIGDPEVSQEVHGSGSVRRR